MDENPDSDGEYWRLGEFMEEHYPLFAIMGIFGTVSVFLSSDFPGGTSALIARAGTFASLVIFGLAAIWIFGRSLGIVFNEHDPKVRPLITELGFVALALCTGVLVASVGVAITNFEEVFEIAGELTVVLVGVVVYLRVYPSDRYSAYGKDAQQIAVVAILLTFFIFMSLSTGVDRFLNDYTTSGYGRLVMIVVVGAILHLGTSEFLRGYFEMLSMDFNLLSKQTLERVSSKSILSSWSFSTSAYVSGLGLAVFTTLLYHRSRILTSNLGYFAIGEYHWQTFTFLHILGAAVFIAILMMSEEIEDEEMSLDGLRITILSALFIAALTVETILVYTGKLGEHVFAI